MKHSFFHCGVALEETPAAVALGEHVEEAEGHVVEAEDGGKYGDDETNCLGMA